jgi:hypothetical protein
LGNSYLFGAQSIAEGKEEKNKATLK